MPRIRTRKNRRGFTLIELLVVVLILGILTAIALPAYLSSVQTSRQNTANANARVLASAVQSHAVTAGAYDTTLTDYNADMGGAMPVNPCTGGVSDYTITAPSASSATVTCSAGTNCGTWTPITYDLSL